MTGPHLDATDPLETLGRLTAAERLDRVRAEDVSQLIDAAERLITVEAARAIDAADAVRPLADRVGTVREQARIRHVRARALAYAGRFDDALADCLEAVRIAETNDLTVEAGRARLASMHALGELGRLDEAIDAGHQARELLLAAGEGALAARADNNLGIVHLCQDRPAAALACFDRARPSLLDEPLALGHVDNSRGEALVAIHDFDGAEAAFHAALGAFENAGAELTAAIATGNLADLASRRGQLQQAVAYYESARRHLETDASPSHAARLRAEEAETQAVLGLPHDALVEYEIALRELDRCGLPLEAARARSGMGRVLVRLGRPAEAETALAAAATAFEELGNATARARVDLVRAELALEHGRQAEARRMATRALAALAERPVDAALARHLLARAAAADGDHETAAAELAAAEVAARRLDLAPLLADILHTRGILHRQAGEIAAAVSDLEEAVAQVERIRGSLQADRFRAAVAGDRSATYSSLIESLLDRGATGAVADAFAVAEKARSRSLLELVAAAPVATAAETEASDPAEGRLRAELDHVRCDLNALYSRLEDERSAGDAASVWQDQVHARERELRTLESRLATTGARVAPFARPTSLTETQELLEDGDALLEYVIIEGRVSVFVVERGRAIVCRDIADTAQVAGVLERLRFQVDRALRPGALEGGRSQRLLGHAQTALRDLDAMLLAPVRGRLADSERLTVVPHGLLHLVPFPALRSDGKHLLETHAVHSVPSASLFGHLLAADAPPAMAEPLVIAAPDEIAPGVTEEGRLAARLLGDRAHLLLGDEATADRAIGDMARASLIHFAGHGRFLPENPHGSGLRLADRWLTVREVGGLRLRARLVTLSGCDTGLARVDAGDELVGLLRGFLVAGAASVILSLWRVDDASASRFMSRLYRGLSAEQHNADLDVRGRLRRTQLEMLADHPHPAFWAPFILVGTP